MINLQYLELPPDLEIGLTYEGTKCYVSGKKVNFRGDVARRCMLVGATDDETVLEAIKHCCYDLFRIEFQSIFRYGDEV